MVAKNLIFMYPFAEFIVAMLQHTHYNLKTDRHEFKMFCEKECNILIKPHSDTGNFPLETCKSDKLVLRTRLFIGFATLPGNISCI